MIYKILWGFPLFSGRIRSAEKRFPSKKLFSSLQAAQKNTGHPLTAGLLTDSALLERHPGHPVHHRGLLVLANGIGPLAAHPQQALSPVRAHAGHNDADHLAAHRQLCGSPGTANQPGPPAPALGGACRRSQPPAPPCGTAGPGAQHTFL